MPILLPLLATALATARPATGDAAAGYARVHHPISCRGALAQANFDQGLTLLYAFSRTAARRAFGRIVAADPHCAIAYWGIAMSYGGNVNFPQDAAGERLGYATIRTALALNAGSASERDCVKALATRYSSASKPNYAVLERAYHRAMGIFAQTYPNDPDAATLFAESGMNLRPWDLYAVDGTSYPGTDEIVATLAAVLKRWPGHIGANHLYVHATEASLHPERAVQAAGRLAALNFEPAAAHLTHMPAHTFVRAGYFRAASAGNVLATEKDRAYLRAVGNKDHAVLAAKIAAARSDTATTIAKLREAVAAQDRLIYIEPPDWYFPVRESLGGALLRAGRPAAAAQVFRADLVRNELNPRSLFGLSEALAAIGDVEGSKLAAKEFRAGWQPEAVTLTVQGL